MTAPLRRDPTRTTQLRRRFMAAIKRKFVALKRAVLKYFEENPLGLVANVGERFVFATDKAKVEAFDKWLQEQIDAGVLVESEYEGFIDTAYKQGVRRAYEETNKAGGIDKTDDFLQGQKEAFLAEAFNGPVARGRVEMLATRSFEALKGVTATMATRMNTLLADGITHGRNPRDIARDMARTIDGLTRQRALTIARTEVIHAHAEGQLDSFDKLGVERLDVEIEWVTAGDNRVCPKCRAKNGTKYVKTDDARGMIPFHPNCRCMWVPAVSVPTEDELADLEKRAEAALLKKKGITDKQTKALQKVDALEQGEDMGRMAANGEFEKASTRMIEGKVADLNNLPMKEYLDLVEAANSQPTTTRKVPLSKLQISQDRVFDDKVRDIVKNFDPTKATIKAVEVDGQIIVVDGHHTLTAHWALGIEPEIEFAVIKTTKQVKKRR